MPQLNVAIVGCGYIANGHVRAWRMVPEAKLTALVDVNENVAKLAAKTWHVPYYFGSLSDAIDKNEIDVIDICTPPQSHAPLAVQAMKSGINVLLEKPMTMTVTDAEKILQSWKKTKVKASVVHNWLFEPPMPEITALFRTGQMGEINSLDLKALNTKFDPMVMNEHHWCHNLPGGRFGEMLAHPIYLVRHFLGEVKLKDIQVSKIGEYFWMKSDELSATFKGGDKIGRFYASFNSPRDIIYLDLYGKEKVVKLDLINVTSNILPKRSISKFGVAFDTLRQTTQLTKSLVKNFLRIASRRWITGHDFFIGLFAQSCLKDIDPPVTIEDGFAVVSILEQVINRMETQEKESCSGKGYKN